MEILGERLRNLRESMKLSQIKIAGLIGTTQASINRYESGTSTPSTKVLLWYADYFDVSMDYIYGRTDQPQGRLYECQPQVGQSDPQLQKFVEMCFDPQSPINNRLKKMLLEMLGEAKP